MEGKPEYPGTNQLEWTRERIELKGKNENGLDQERIELKGTSEKREEPERIRHTKADTEVIRVREGSSVYIGSDNPRDGAFRAFVKEVLERILDIADPYPPTKDKIRAIYARDGNESRPTTLVAVGKAALSMALAAADVLGDILDAGLVVAPADAALTSKGGSAFRKIEEQGIEVILAEHPYPGEGSFKAGERAVELMERCGKDEECLFLLSGGASSLAELEFEGFPRKDMTEVHKRLVTSGADIVEINIVRKHMSRIKGGRLAGMFRGSRMHNLIISDVPGSDLSTIGSGPTSPDREDSTFGRCAEILKQYGIWDDLSDAGREFIREVSEEYETPKTLPHPERFTYHVLLSNGKLVREVAEALEGYERVDKAVPLSVDDPGSADLTVDGLVERILEISHREEKEEKREATSWITGSGSPSYTAYVIGGEPTLEVPEGVSERGSGGRVQHVALTFAKESTGEEKLRQRTGRSALIAFATDGIDGNSPGAGAVVDGTFWCNLRDADLSRRMPEESGETRREPMLNEIKRYLKNYDSHTFFREYGSDVVAGPTGTNLSDLYILLIRDP